jgi:6-hydroxytryprostatin B O-methyltransferase
MPLQVLYQFRITEHVPLNSLISYVDLAQACGLDEPRPTRIVRHLILSHIFAESRPGNVGHSSNFHLLATEPQGIDFLGHTTDDVFLAACHQTCALRNAPNGTIPSDCGASLAFSNGKRSCLWHIQLRVRADATIR